MIKSLTTWRPQRPRPLRRLGDRLFKVMLDDTFLPELSPRPSISFAAYILSFFHALRGLFLCVFLTTDCCFFFPFEPGSPTIRRLTVSDNNHLPFHISPLTSICTNSVHGVINRSRCEPNGPPAFVPVTGIDGHERILDSPHIPDHVSSQQRQRKTVLDYTGHSESGQGDNHPTRGEGGKQKSANRIRAFHS